MNNKCSKCGKGFECNPGIACWCNDLPGIKTEGKFINSCLCQACLSDEIHTFFNDNPQEAKVFMSRENTAPNNNITLTEDLDYYINEQGNWVFTKYYHLKKGYCCNNGCINCPYGFEKN